MKSSALKWESLALHHREVVKTDELRALARVRGFAVDVLEKD